MSAECESPAVVPASLGVVEQRLGRTKTVPVRLRFVPYGRPRVGKPGRGDNRILFAEAYHSHTFFGDEWPTLWMEANGIKYLLADGCHYRDESFELADEFPEEVSLAGTGQILGRESPDGRGFYPVGVHVEVAVGPRSATSTAELREANE